MVPTNFVQVQGQGAVTADQLNTFVQTVDVISTLRNFVGVAGMEILLQGANSPGDGGDGQYYWSNAAGVDNGTTVIVPYAIPSGQAGCWIKVGSQIKVAFDAYPSVPQSLSTGVETQLAFGAVGFDLNSNFSTSLNAFIAPIAGVYQFFGYFSVESTAAIRLDVRVNGGQYATLFDTTSATLLANSGPVLIKLNASDQVSLWAVSAANSTVNNGRGGAFFQGALLIATS